MNSLNTITTALYIAEGLKLSGSLELNDDRTITIEGEFNGSLTTAGEIVVGTTGRLMGGPIVANSLLLMGKLVDVASTTVHGLLDVRASASLESSAGVVRYGELAMERGAALSAKLEASGAVPVARSEVHRGAMERISSQSITTDTGAANMAQTLAPQSPPASAQMTTQIPAQMPAPTPLKAVQAAPVLLDTVPAELDDEPLRTQSALSSPFSLNFNAPALHEIGSDSKPLTDSSAPKAASTEAPQVIANIEGLDELEGLEELGDFHQAHRAAGG